MAWTFFVSGDFVLVGLFLFLRFVDSNFKMFGANKTSFGGGGGFGATNNSGGFGAAASTPFGGGNSKYR